jgi:hypothetical protein
MLARLFKPPVLNVFSSMSPVINRAAFIASMSTSSDQKIIKRDDSAEEDEEKSALVRSIMKKLKGPLADENGHIPTGSQRPIAIEVDGPAHFYVNTTKYTAYTKLKHRLLTRMGYKVLHVPYFEWRKLKGAKDRRRYLEEKLKEEPTEWLDPEDEKIYADRMAKAEEALASKPPPPKGPRPTRRK